jgi:teichoic acid transport system ATP-binding protein
MEKAIIASNITKRYKLFDDTKDRLLDLITHKSYGEDFYALTDVSFEAEKGDVVGFVGINGSGKSTLSNIIAGIVPETSGTVKVNGQVSIIAVASGLKGDLTGRDNIELKLLMLGFNRNEVHELEPGIIEFAELEKFIDQPVKSYSSGMKSRLGFAISVNVNPDILIIDEALSVGDKAFAEKSLNKMKEFKKQGKTMIFVSHSIGQMKQFCEKILWLEFGKVKDYGAVKEVIPKYEAFLKQWQQMSKKEREAYRSFELDFDEKLPNDPLAEIYQARIDNRHPFEHDENYKEEPISRIGHIKSGKSSIYSTLSDETEMKSSEDYKYNAFYIKKEATHNGELYYLLSHEPSAIDGVVGWMTASRISSQSHVAIDNDPKTFYLTGRGAGYSRPWGSKKNKVYDDLSSFKNAVFKVNKTDKIGGKTWYRGILNDKQIWIFGGRVEEIPSKSQNTIE